MNLNWFPGHMAKTRRLIEDNLKLVDIVMELVDARLPLSSRNPEIDKLIMNKPRLVVMNKCDMADSAANEAWINYFKDNKIAAIAVSSVTGVGMNKIVPAVQKVLSEKIARDKAKGLNRTIKLMIVGIPNVGKSTFINKLSGRASTKTGDRPGVTRGKQWIRIVSGIELLDTPGILWPKIDNEQVALYLAFTGAIKDQVIDIETLACRLLELLGVNYLDKLKQRYKLDEVKSLEGHELLADICKKRGFIVSGGELDYTRGANIVIDEFRACKIGNISLERP